MESPSTETTELFFFSYDKTPSTPGWPANRGNPPCPCPWHRQHPPARCLELGHLSPGWGRPLGTGVGPRGWGEDSWWEQGWRGSRTQDSLQGLGSSSLKQGTPVWKQRWRRRVLRQLCAHQPRTCPLSTAHGPQAAHHQRHGAARPALPAARPFSPGAPAPSVPAAPRPTAPVETRQLPTTSGSPRCLQPSSSDLAGLLCCSPGREDSSARDACLDSR